jgi:hypothetical protein
MAEIPISPTEFEKAIFSILPAINTEQDDCESLEIVDYDNITGLLNRLGKPEWGRIPRTYAVLHMINSVDKMDAFVSKGLKDIHLPYTEMLLPNDLTTLNKAKFVEKQKLVLTKAADLEKNYDRHSHFGTSKHRNIFNLHRDLLHPRAICRRSLSGKKGLRTRQDGNG